MYEQRTTSFRSSNNWPRARFGRGALLWMTGALSFLLLVQVAAGAGNSSVQSIANVTQKNTGVVFVVAKNGNWGNPDGCSHSDRFMIPANAKARKELLALVLSGHLQGRRVRARLSGCSRASPAGVSFPIAVSITLF